MSKYGRQTCFGALLALVITFGANAALGAIVIRVTEVGGNLAVTTSGSADTTQWGAPGGDTNNGVLVYVNYFSQFIAFGTGQQSFWLGAGAAGAFVFTDHGLADNSYFASAVSLTSGGGDVGFRPGDNIVWLPSGYASGTPINQVLTITGASFASTGLTDGDYAVLSWGGTNPDSITFAIGSALPVELQSFVVE